MKLKAIITHIDIEKYLDTMIADSREKVTVLTPIKDIEGVRD